MIQNSVYLGLSFVPAIGPLCSVAFTIAMTAITDPDSFKAENILKLSPEVLVAVVSSARAVKGNIPKGFSFKKPIAT